MTRAARLAVAVLCLTAVLAAGLPSGACAPPAAPSDPREAVITAYNNQNTLQSCHLSYTYEIVMTVGRDTTSILTAIESDYNAKPLRYKNAGTLTFQSGRQKDSSPLLQYIEQDGDRFAVYSRKDGKWVKQYLPSFDPFADYDQYFKIVKSAALLRDYLATAVYEVTIDGRYLGRAMARSLGILSGRQAAVPDELAADIGDLTYTVTIDKTAATVSRADVDLTALVAAVSDKLLRSLPAGQEPAFRQIFRIDKATVTFAFSRFNAVGKIVIPPEALAAPLDKKPAPAQTTEKE